MKVGVTGIFASGKGTVCKMFEELGAVVIDTDIIARQIVEPGKPGLEAIKLHFGIEFIRADGSLDRHLFAQHVFKNKSRVTMLNSITHPFILEQVLRLATDPTQIYMVNTPLLFESGFHKHMDKTIVVRANSEQVLERGMLRDGISQKEIEKRLKFQIPLNEKVKLADYVIDNTGPLEITKRQVSKLWNTLKITT